MKKQLLNVSIIVLIFTLFSSSACNEKNDTTPENVQLTFKLAHYVGPVALEFNDIIYSNAFGNPYSVVTLKYFISDIKLHSADGSTVVTIDAEHYADATDEQTLSFQTGTNIPGGEYSSISFVFGLTEEKNISGSYPNPPESNMEWPEPMGGGYHYMKLEGKLDSAGVIKNYQAHTGASMGNPYFISVTLPGSSFNANGNKTINIGMDINKWWENPNTLDLNTMTAVMGNETMQQKLKDNGNDVFFLISIE